MTRLPTTQIASGFHLESKIAFETKAAQGLDSRHVSIKTLPINAAMSDQIRVGIQRVLNSCELESRGS